MPQLLYPELKACFPWFGGKRIVASEVWARFLTGGQGMRNYIEPFAGSLAILLQRPKSSIERNTLETINDFDCYVANFWRSLKMDPDQVAHHADYPVMEVDLIARNNWLVAQRKEFQQKMLDPNFMDPKVAGWWVWGLSQWIGGGFADKNVGKKLPSLSGERGVHARTGRRRFRAWVHTHEEMNEEGLAIRDRLRILADRLRTVRVTCGDWTACMGESVVDMGPGNITGIVLDPPYSAGEHNVKYAADAHQSAGRDIAEEVRQWAVSQSRVPNIRIALCGYESAKHPMPDDWFTYEWKAAGGFGNQGAVTRKLITAADLHFGKTLAEMDAESIIEGEGKKNAHRERIWFSPSCLQLQTDLFEGMEHT